MVALKVVLCDDEHVTRCDNIDAMIDNNNVTIDNKAIPSGIPVSGPLPHQFLAMYYFDYYWYCTCIILFNVHCEAHGFCLQVS